MPGWSVHILNWVQQFAEEEGLLLGVTLAGYALDMWVRLFHASRALDRVRNAPAVGISILPLLLDQPPSPAEASEEASTSSSSTAQESPAPPRAPDTDQVAATGPSPDVTLPVVPEVRPQRSLRSLLSHVSLRRFMKAPRSQIVPADSTKSSTNSSRASGGGSEGIVVVRGRVQASLDSPKWFLPSPGTLLKAEHSSARGVVVERVDKVVCSNMHQFLHQVSEHQVDMRRNQVPFELSEIPSSATSLPPLPPSSSSSPSSSTSSSSTIAPSSSLSFPSSSLAAPRVRVSLEGLTQPLPLVTVHSAFHRSSPSLTSLILHFVTGSQPIGQKVEERVLMAGTDLTAVGHMKRDKDGNVAIAPSPDLPVFLTPLTKEQLVLHLSGTCAGLFNTSLMFSAAAAATLAFVFYRKWDHRRRQERARRLVENLAELERALARRQALAQGQVQGQGRSGPAGSGTPGPVGSAAGEGGTRLAAPGEAQGSEGVGGIGDGEEPAEDLSNVGNGELCVVCLSRRRRAVFVPCGHLVCCWACAQTVRSRVAQQRGSEPPCCPVCRAHFTDVIRVFNS